MRNSLRIRFACGVLLLSVLLSACGDNSESADEAKPKSGCDYVVSENAAKKATLPETKPATVEAMTIATSYGDIAVTFDADNAPCTVNSFVSLAQQGYFDGTRCHRLVPGFVLQCGDPSASGMGGPGYRFADELTGDETYTTGTLAMANAGPGTNGSQFFIVLADVDLPPNYTVFGQVDARGMTVAHEIEAAGVLSNSETPVKDVLITSVS